MKRYLIPLGLFLVLAVFLGISLSRDPREVPSPLIGKPAPAFSLPTLGTSGQANGPAFSPQDKGENMKDRRNCHHFPHERGAFPLHATCAG